MNIKHTFYILLAMISSALIYQVYTALSRRNTNPVISKKLMLMGLSHDIRPQSDGRISTTSGVKSQGFFMKAMPEAPPPPSKAGQRDHIIRKDQGIRTTEQTHLAKNSHQEHVLTLKEQYRLSCKYVKTPKGLIPVCVDRFKNGSRGRLTAKALMSHPHYFTEKLALRPANKTGNGKKHAIDIQGERFDDEGHGVMSDSPKKFKPPVKHDERHRSDSIIKKPPSSKLNKPGVLSYTHWVYSKDPHNYKYLVNPSSTCTDGRRDLRVDLLVLVASHPANSARRNVIRETWGAPQGGGDNALPPIVWVRFLLGVMSPGGELGESLQREIATHSDIIVEEFFDSYLNLTVKTVMGLKWASRYCPTARFVMKTDDDMVINMPRLLAYLHTAPHHSFIAGRLAKSFPVIRDPSEKFYVPEEVYPKTTYPDYCVGLGYIMSSDVVRRLYLQAFLTDLFPWEDVYVGIMLKEIGIIPRDIKHFYYFEGSSIFKGETIVNPTKVFIHLRSYYVLHGLSPQQSRILWKQWQQ